MFIFIGYYSLLLYHNQNVINKSDLTYEVKEACRRKKGVEATLPKPYLKPCCFAFIEIECTHEMFA